MATDLTEQERRALIEKAVQSEIERLKDCIVIHDAETLKQKNPNSKNYLIPYSKNYLLPSGNKPAAYIPSLKIYVEINKDAAPYYMMFDPYSNIPIFGGIYDLSKLLFGKKSAKYKKDQQAAQTTAKVLEVSAFRKKICAGLRMFSKDIGVVNKRLIKILFPISATAKAVSGAAIGSMAFSVSGISFSVVTIAIIAIILSRVGIEVFCQSVKVNNLPTTIDHNGDA